MERLKFLHKKLTVKQMIQRHVDPVDPIIYSPCFSECSFRLVVLIYLCYTMFGLTEGHI